jgi:hypothetical protein
VVPEQVDLNLREIDRLTEQAVESGARRVIFHEGTACALGFHAATYR